MPVTNQGQLDMNLSWGVGFTSSDVAEVGELPKPIVRAPNATATVHVPVRGDAGISDSGMPVEYAKGVKVLNMGGGEVDLVVGSGRYEFVGKLAR